MMNFFHFGRHPDLESMPAYLWTEKTLLQLIVALRINLPKDQTHEFFDKLLSGENFKGNPFIHFEKN